LRKRIFVRATSRRSSWSVSIPPRSLHRSSIGGLCLILDQDALRVPPEQALAEAREAGVRFFQYRNKTDSRRAVYERARTLAQQCRQAEAIFIVNDHADIAAAVRADGVHLGQDDLPIDAARRVMGSTALIGISTHSLAQAEAAQSAGADYIGFGPVFPTGTKDAGIPRGLDDLRAVTSRVAIPVIAIGGITETNAGSAIAAGARGIAVISAVLAGASVRQAAARLVDCIAREQKSSRGAGEGL
jgi:thiamine-phosphate pyrophosphorylase